MKIAIVRRASTVLAAAAAALLVSSASPEAQAQEAANDSVSGDGKGIVGGALLGGEVVTITMGIIGVEEGWPYLVFGGVGAVGGAIGGWGVEQADPPAEAPLFMLAGGLTLLVPAIVISLNATSADDPIDETPSDTERAEPPQPAPGAPAAPPASGGASVNLGAENDAVDSGRRVATVRRGTTARPAPRMSAVDFRGDGLQLGVPAVQVQPLYTRREISEYGVKQGTEVRVPVISAAF